METNNKDNIKNNSNYNTNSEIITKLNETVKKLRLDKFNTTYAINIILLYLVGTFFLAKLSYRMLPNVLIPYASTLINIVFLILISSYTVQRAKGLSKIDETQVKSVKLSMRNILLCTMVAMIIITIFPIFNVADNFYRLEINSIRSIGVTLLLELAHFISEFFLVLITSYQVLEKVVTEKKLSIKPYLITIPIFIIIDIGSFFILSKIVENIL